MYEDGGDQPPNLSVADFEQALAKVVARGGFRDEQPHDRLEILSKLGQKEHHDADRNEPEGQWSEPIIAQWSEEMAPVAQLLTVIGLDRKSIRLNSSHAN